MLLWDRVYECTPGQSGGVASVSYVFPKPQLLQSKAGCRGGGWPGARSPAEQQSRAVGMERKRQGWDKWRRREQGLGSHLREAMCPGYPA